MTNIKIHFILHWMEIKLTFATHFGWSYLLETIASIIYFQFEDNIESFAAVCLKNLFLRGLSIWITALAANMLVLFRVESWAETSSWTSSTTSSSPSSCSPRQASIRVVDGLFEIFRYGQVDQLRSIYYTGRIVIFVVNLLEKVRFRKIWSTNMLLANLHHCVMLDK